MLEEQIFNILLNYGLAGIIFYAFYKLLDKIINNGLDRINNSISQLTEQINQLNTKLDLLVELAKRWEND